MTSYKREIVYEALNDIPDMVFCAYMYALSGINRAFALTVMDDPSPNQKLEEAIKPFLERIGQ